MKNDKPISAAADQLISLKPFSELTEAEKNTVLSEMSEEEYTLMRETALESGKVLHQTTSTPDSSIKSSLLSAYDKKYSQPKQRSVLMYSIPLYQAVAAVALVVIILAGFNFYSKNQDITSQHVVYVEKKDTVYIPSRSVAVTPSDSGQGNNNIPVPSPVHKTQLNYTTTSRKEKEVASVNLSRSIKQDSALKQFMVVSAYLN